MKRSLIFLGLMTLPMAMPLRAQQVIAQDSNGIIVEVKEKYGGNFVDTCTVVMHQNGQSVLVKPEGAIGWFPSSFHSVRIIGRLEPRKQALAANMEREEDVRIR